MVSYRNRVIWGNFYFPFLSEMEGKKSFFLTGEKGRFWAPPAAVYGGATAEARRAPWPDSGSSTKEKLEFFLKEG